MTDAEKRKSSISWQELRRWKTVVAFMVEIERSPQLTGLELRRRALKVTRRDVNRNSRLVHNFQAGIDCHSAYIAS